ncbi:TRADD-N-associated membrane domain-containing protein [Streptomyces sp. NPDC002990]
MGEWLLSGGVVAVLVAAVVVMERAAGAAFERRRAEARARLLAQVAEPAKSAAPAAHSSDPKYADVGGIRPTAEQLDRRDEFTPLLVEYYAYGLTQARSSFATSQIFAGLGAAILLFGVGLAVWKAESSGDLYLGVVTCSVGLVVALVGQLFHRRADIALKHMADQTASLRDDRRAAETTQQAIRLLDEVGDPVLRARLQAGLIMKLSGAELPG